MPTQFWPDLVIGDEASFQMNARLCISHHFTLCDELISINLGNLKKKSVGIKQLSFYVAMLCE